MLCDDSGSDSLASWQNHYAPSSCDFFKASAQLPVLLKQHYVVIICRRCQILIKAHTEGCVGWRGGLYLFAHDLLKITTPLKSPSIFTLHHCERDHSLFSPHMRALTHWNQTCSWRSSGSPLIDWMIIKTFANTDNRLRVWSVCQVWKGCCLFFFVFKIFVGMKMK